MLQTNWNPAPPHKLTHWFSANKFNPGTPGVYQRKNGKDLHYPYWTGEYWVQYGRTIENAYMVHRNCNDPSDYQNLPFRGLKNGNPKSL